MNTIQTKLSKTLLSGAAIALLGAATPAYAQSVSLIDIESVYIPNDGYANVSYAYYVSKYEVTNAQYAVFLNAVASDVATTPGDFLWNGNTQFTRTSDGTTYTYEVASGKENHPVIHVSLLDAKRFCNWLTNRKNALIEIESGIYNGLPAYSSNYQNVFFPSSGGVADPNSAPVARAPRDVIAWGVEKGVALLTTSEWEKAAFWDPNKDGGPGWWTYATTATRKAADSNALDELTTAWANYDNAYGVNTTTAVDLFKQYASGYGVVDMTGNVFEWTDSFRNGGINNHFVKGGHFDTTAGHVNLKRNANQYTAFYDQTANNGFRVASLDVLPTIFPVPEPSTYALVGGVGAVALAVLRRRRKG